MKTFDSWAWVEYFKGSPEGAIVRTIIEGTEVLFTPAICLAEIKAKFIAENKDPEERLQFIKSRTSIIDINSEVAEDAADLKMQHRLHMVDALVLACARACDSELITGDKHFRGVPRVTLLASEG
jgi:predicted nucleic acid-binding protein